MATLLTSTPANVGTSARTDAPRAQRLPRWFGVAMAVAAVGVLVAGFAPSFYARPRTMPALRAIVIAHGVLFSSWILLFLVQAALVATRHVRIHRWLGYAGACLATIMVVTAPPMAVSLARRGQPDGDPLLFMLVIVVDVLMFGVLVAAAIYHRRRGETHRRLMLLAMITLLPPAISRWPYVVRRPVAGMMVVMLAFIVAAPLADLLSGRRPHPISLWGGLLLVASMPLRFALGQTAAWHQFARWLIS